MGSFVSRRRGHRAFTLIEAGVVLVALALLAAIAIPTYNQFIESTKQGTAEASAQTYISQARALASLEEGSQPGSTLQSLPEVWVAAGQDMNEGSYIEGVATPLPADATPSDLNGAEPGLPSFDLLAGELSGPISFGHSLDSTYYPVDITVIGDSVSVTGDEGQASPPSLATTPDAPTNVVATAGSGQVAVSWSPPSSDGGSAVTGYTVSYGTSSTGPWTQAASAVAGTSYTVTGLSNGTAYWFQVTAQNAVGSGAAAVSTSSTTPYAPLSLSYASTQFTTGSNSQTLTATATGGSGAKTYSVTSGSLPGGVTFDPATGTFTGPSSSEWNFSASQLSVGGAHACVVTSAGGVKCWGGNWSGQLGDGTATHRSTPVDVTGLTSGVTAVSAGQNHTCALTTSGGVKCWGRNMSGELGDNSTTERRTPVDVVGLTSGVASVAAGSSLTCAVTTSGGAKCWGTNGFGELGNGNNNRSSVPVDVLGLTSGVASIEPGSQNNCAVTTAGGVKCWGGGTPDLWTPADVAGLTSGVTAVSTGSYTACAIMAAGGVQCWGQNNRGQLGNGTTTNSSTPVEVVGLTGAVTSISVGSQHVCASTGSGGTKCWGTNIWFQLGDGTATQRTTPVDVVGLTSGVSVAGAGVDQSCALLDSGAVKCWGGNTYHQLGNGTTTPSSVPVDVQFGEGFGPQPGFPATLTVAVTDSTGSSATDVTLTRS